MFKSTLKYSPPFISMHIPLQQIVYSVSTYAALENPYIMRAKFF